MKVNTILSKAKLHPSLRKFLIKFFEVDVRDNLNIQGVNVFAYVCLTKTDKLKYKIVLDSALDKVSPEFLTFVILHEISHVLRGDLTLVENKQNTFLRNIAQDAVINHVLGEYRPLIEKDLEELNSQLVWYDELLKEEIVKGNFPSCPPGWLKIYEYLEKNQSAVNRIFDIVEAADEGGKQIDKQELKELEAKVYIDIKTNEGLEEFAKNVGKQEMRKHLTKIECSVLKIPTLEKILEAVRFMNIRGERKPEFSYKYPGRVPGLRGRVLFPRPSIGIGIDVSGSFEHKKELAISLARALSLDNDVTGYVWSDSCEKVNLGKIVNAPYVGGGTVVNSILAKCIQHDLMIIITDGLFSESPEEMKFTSNLPIIYVLPEKSPTGFKRKQDYIVFVDAFND